MFTGKRCIIFDLDGTIIDSVGIWNDTDRALIRTLGGEDMEAGAVGIRRDRLLREFKDAGNPYEAYCAWIAAEYGAEASGAELLQRRDAIAREKLAHEIDYKPGAEQFLAFLKKHGFTLGIATTTRRKNIDIYQHENENIRRKAPFASYFSFIYTREDVSTIKPDPEIYEKIQREWKLSPSECLIFEDSLTGVLAARNAGIEVVSMYDRYSEAEQEEIQRLSTYHFQNYGEALEKSNEELRMKK